MTKQTDCNLEKKFREIERNREMRNKSNKIMRDLLMRENVRHLNRLIHKD